LTVDEVQMGKERKGQSSWGLGEEKADTGQENRGRVTAV